jgi:hypothetical protein
LCSSVESWSRDQLLLLLLLVVVMMVVVVVVLLLLSVSHLVSSFGSCRGLARPENHPQQWCFSLQWWWC